MLAKGQCDQDAVIEGHLVGDEVRKASLVAHGKEHSSISISVVGSGQVQAGKLHGLPGYSPALPYTTLSLVSSSLATLAFGALLRISQILFCL